MNQISIGRFIADCRKKKNLTQKQLADKLNITDRAVSKWETGRGIPDSSIMIELCDILGITVNDLLSGETVSAERYSEKSEENLLRLQRQNENYSKQLLNLETVIGIIGTCSSLILWLVASFSKLHITLKLIMMLVATAVFITTLFCALKIEQTAGYYECGNCKHRYVPDFGSVLFSLHSGRRRCMICPKCKKPSWHKKVVLNESNED